MNSYVHIGRAMRAAHTRARAAMQTTAPTGRPMPTRQRGFTLVTAIFLLVVLAAMGAFMVSISGTQHFTSLYALQGAKAYHAAKSGIEWGLANAIAGTCTTGQTLSLQGSLDDFTVVVDCVTSLHNEAGIDYDVFQITSSASTSAALGTPGFAGRQIGAVVTNY